MSGTELRILVPGTGANWTCGGLFVAMKFARLMNKIVPTKVWTYVDREEGFPLLDLGRIPEDDRIIWVVTWGPHVDRLLRSLKEEKVVYYAQSTGWRISMPLGVPILSGSRFIMASWAQMAPHNPIYLLKQVLDENCRNWGLNRDIDVLYLRRKSTKYLNDILIPELQKYCTVYIHEHVVPEYTQVLRLYNRSKVYLYSSENPIRVPGGGRWVEGFGLQPLEAMACGCTVFSNLHGGLSDYLDPAVCGNKLETFSKEYDLKRILEAVRSHVGHNPKEDFLRRSYSMENFYKRMTTIWPEIVEFLAFRIKSRSSSWSRGHELNVSNALKRLLHIGRS